MNAGLREFVPNWFRQGDHHMEDDTPREPPPIAIIPMPEPTEEEKRLKVIADAHIFVAQLAQERAAKDQQIEQLQAEVGRLTHQVQGEIRRADLAELELSQAHNDIQTRIADFAEKERTLQLLRQVLDKFGTKAPEKPPRKSKKKADGESATEAPKTDQ